jgi:hypothetical protein
MAMLAEDLFNKGRKPGSFLVFFVAYTDERPERLAKG